MTTTSGTPPSSEVQDIPPSASLTRPRMLGAAAAGLAVTSVVLALLMRARAKRRRDAELAQRLRRAALLATLGFGLARRTLARPLTSNPKLTAELGAGLLLEANNMLQRRRATRGLDWPGRRPAGLGGSLRRPYA